MPYFSLHWLSSKHFSEFLHIQYFRLLLPQHCFEMKQVRIRNGLQSVSSSHSISVSHTDTRTLAYRHAHVHIHAHTEGKRQKNPCLRHCNFFPFSAFHSLFFSDNEKCRIWNSGLTAQHPAFCYSYTNTKWQDGYSLCTLTVHSRLGKMSKMFSHGWVDLITIL